MRTTSMSTMKILKNPFWKCNMPPDGGFDFWSNENQASWTSPFQGPRGANFVAGGFGWNQPTQEFVSEYEEGDERKDATILYEGGPFI